MEKSKKSNMIHAPWTDEQVQKLNDYQKEGWFHPFTCPGNDSDDEEVSENECPSRNLIATRDGWICACGRYKQDWAWEMMTQGKPSWLEDYTKQLEKISGMKD